MATLSVGRNEAAAAAKKPGRGAIIPEIKATRGMQSGSTLYYQIELRTRDGKKHTLASQISAQRLARRIVEDLEAALDIAPAGLAREELA